VNLFLKRNFNDTQLIPSIETQHQTKQKQKHYNNNEHKQNTIKKENYLLMGASLWLLQLENKIWHLGPSTTLQHSSLTFPITFKDLTNNHYKWYCNQTWQFVPIASRKTLLWHTPKLFDGLNYKSKGENNGRKRSWGTL
jgi:hypothetical protein